MMGIRPLAIIMFPAPKRNVGSHRFERDLEVETSVARWLITPTRPYGRQQGTEEPACVVINISFGRGLCGKSNGVTV